MTFYLFYYEDKDLNVYLVLRNIKKHVETCISYELFVNLLTTSLEMQLYSYNI